MEKDYQQAVRISKKVARIIGTELRKRPMVYPIFIGIVHPLMTLVDTIPRKHRSQEVEQLLRWMKLCMNKAGEAMTTGEDTKGTAGQREIS